MRRLIHALLAVGFFFTFNTFFLTMGAKTAWSTTLKIVDQSGDETVLTNIKIYYRYSGVSRSGLRIKKGKGEIELKWEKAKKITFIKPFQAEIILTSGKIIKTSAVKDWGKGVTGETDLGTYNIRLKHIKFIETLSEKKIAKVSPKTSLAPKFVPPKIKMPKPIKIPKSVLQNFKPKLSGLPNLASIPRPQGDRKNYLKFINKSGLIALVRIFDYHRKIRVNEVKVPNLSVKGVLIKNGDYYIITRYGNQEAKCSYSKGKKISFKAPKNKRHITTITLHKITGGNYPTKKASKSEFERK